MSESMRVMMAALGVCLGVGALLSGCGQVVGADCANGGDYCGSICCPSEYSCVNDVCFLPDGGAVTGDSGPCGWLSLLCGSQCIDPLENDDHCGACGSACGDGLSCALGACVDGCRVEQIFCGGDCRNPLDDDDHCGACGTVCGDGLSCALGVCVDGCRVEQIFCGGDCRNPLDDNDHCGACGTVCGGGFDCQGGLCISECGLDEGYCDGDCRQLMSDDDHCGACGDHCGSGFDCRLGVCAPEACDIGTANCAGTCRSLDSDPANCGGCGVVCGTDQVCNGGTCADLCVTPRLVCDEWCVDPATSGRNCGSCGTACESGICRRGTCEDATFGHLVLIGHDYSSWVTGMNAVVGTAALISLDHEIAVLAFEGDAQAASITGAHAALDEVADATGRDIDYNGESIVARVPDRLLGSDVFLIHSQHGATNDELWAVGFTWRHALRSFLRRGGVVIVLDAGGSNSGTHQLIEAAGLISIDNRRSLSTGTPLRVIDGADAVSRGVPIAYVAPSRSAGFEMRSTVGWVVATDDAAGLPVVIHTVFSP